MLVKWSPNSNAATRRFQGLFHPRFFGRGHDTRAWRSCKLEFKDPGFY
jgi:hypothetical protein